MFLFSYLNVLEQNSVTAMVWFETTLDEKVSSIMQLKQEAKLNSSSNY